MMTTSPGVPSDDVLDLREQRDAVHTRIGQFVPTRAPKRPAPADVFVSPEHSLIVVADGLGPANSPDASATIVTKSMRTLARRLRPGMNRDQASTLVNMALAQCNAALIGRSRETRGNTGRGASVLVALRIGPELLIKSVGDCRCYLVRNAEISAVTHDHTLNELLSNTSGFVQARFPGLTPNRGVLRHLGQHDFVPNNEFQSIELRSGDRLICCTRGVTSVLSDTEIANMLSQAAAPAAATRKMVSRASRQGAKSAVAAAAIFVSAQNRQPANA